MRVLPGPTKSNQVLAWSPDGRWLVAGGSGDGIMVWDVDANAPGRRIFATAHGGKLMRFCRTNERLYVAFQSGGVWDWNPGTDEERLHPWSDRYHRYYGFTLADHGRAAALNTFRESPTGAGVESQDVGYAITADGLTVERWARPNGHNWNSSHSFAFRCGSDELFGIGSHAGGTQFVRVRTTDGALLGSFDPPGAVRSWVLAPDDSRVAWVSEHGLHVRDFEPGAPALELPAAGGEHRRGLAWSPDSRLISYTTGTTVRLLDAGTLSEVRALDWNIGKPRAVAFHPDGLRAAVSGEGGRGWVTVFDLE
ncbi:MAG TPA: WD40 repeat domain-containing protein [Gemmata sp.]